MFNANVAPALPVSLTSYGAREYAPLAASCDKVHDLEALFFHDRPRLLLRLRSFRGRVAAEDVVQSAFIKMLETDVRITDASAYLTRLTRNLAIDELRRANRAPLACVSIAAIEGVANFEKTAEDRLIEHERIAFMLAAVAALPERERQTLLMAKFLGLSHAEIAARLGVSRHTVPRYLACALAACAAALTAFEALGAP